MKMKFIKYVDPDNQFDNFAVEVSTDSVALWDIVEEFKGFLMASGFHPDLVNQIGEVDEDQV